MLVKFFSDFFQAGIFSGSAEEAHLYVRYLKKKRPSIEQVKLLHPSIIEVMFPRQKSTRLIFLLHNQVCGCRLFWSSVFFSRRFCFGDFESNAIKVEKETSQHYNKIIKVSLGIPYSSRVRGRPAEAEVATDSSAIDNVLNIVNFDSGQSGCSLAIGPFPHKVTLGVPRKGKWGKQLKGKKGNVNYVASSLIV